jgi:predicted lipoprotein with Yx(FWY)xxD motif
MHKYARPTLLAGFVAASLVTGAALAQAPEQKAPQDQTRQEKQEEKTARINVASSPELGEHLVDAQGKPLYVFTADRGKDHSTCTGACAVTWPPFITTEAPSAVAPSLDASKLSTLTRSDGSKQVTYGGMPLYHYARDTQGRMAMGQDIKSFGGEWYLVAPTGRMITKAKPKTGEQGQEKKQQQQSQQQEQPHQPSPGY